eukprot:Opistho-1_new@95611
MRTGVPRPLIGSAGGAGRIVAMRATGYCIYIQPLWSSGQRARLHPTGEVEHRRGPRLELRYRQGRREQEALDLVAAGALQEIALRHRLHTLGDHAQPQRTRHLDHRLRDAGIALVTRQALDEAAVDLELLDRKALQVAEARIAGAEIVDRELHAEPVERTQALQGLVGVADQDRLGQLELEPGRRQFGLGQHRRHAVDEVGLLELQRRHVHRHHHRAALCTPQRGLAHRLAQHPVTQRDDEAALLRDRNELARRDVAEVGISPAQQRLGTDHRARGDVDLRLVVQPEVAALQRQAHRVVQLHARQQVDVHLRLVEAEAGTAALLHAVHRGVGVLDQVVHRLAVVRVHRDADARGDAEAHALERERLPQHLEHAPRNGLGTARIGLVQQHHELVATEPRHGVDLAQAGLQPLGHLDEHAVAEHVTERVVDLLEAVEVEEQQRERRLDFALAMSHR